MVAAYGVAGVLWLGFDLGVLTLLSWLSLPLAVKLMRTLWRAVDGPTLNKTLAGTARLALLFSLLLALGILLGSLLPI